MKKDTLRTVVIIVGVLILVAIVALGSAAWLFMRSFSLGQVDERTASQQFDEIRGKFAGVTPGTDHPGREAHRHAAPSQ